MQNFFFNFLNNDFFFIAWSLAIEEYFYLIFPIFLITINSSFSKISIIFIILFTFIKILTLINLQQQDYEFFRMGTFIRLDSIAVGVLARIYLNFFSKNKFFILFFSFLVIIYLFPNFKNLTKIELFLYIIFIQVFSVSFLILFINYEKNFNNKFLLKVGNTVSSQTYSIYLFHMIFIYFLIILDFNPVISFFLYLFLLHYFSLIFYNFFEKPLNKLRPKV